METYGVSFEGFEPWCGKDLYDDIIMAKIPAAEETLAGARFRPSVNHYMARDWD